MVKQQCLFGTLLSIKVPGRHFLFPESWRKGVKMAEPNRQSGENEERIIEIEIERLRPFKEHPFQVKDKTRVRSLIFRLATLAYHRRILFTDFFSQSQLLSLEVYTNFGILPHSYRLASERGLPSCIFSFRFFFLLLYIFFYSFFCNIAYCRYIISSSPE